MRGLNIYKRKDGRYRRQNYQRKGNRRQTVVSIFFGETRQAVQAKMKSVQQLFAQVAELDLTIKSLCEEWLLSIHHRVKESTLANYQLKAEKHILPNFASIKVLELSSEDIYRFIRNYSVPPRKSIENPQC